MSLSDGQGGRTFFADPRLDRDLPDANRVFWNALIEHIEQDGRRTAHSILDVGCHTGGLLEVLKTRFSPTTLIGIEPLPDARSAAMTRLASGGGPSIEILPPSDWDMITAHSIDLLVSHEMLYLEPDVPMFMRQVRRVLTPDGSAYVVLGCHAENPLWAIWKSRVETVENKTYDHAPMDILAAASNAGLATAVRPLRRTGWVTYDARQADFPYPDLKTMFDHHYRYKLLFRFVPSHATPPA